MKHFCRFFAPLICLMAIAGCDSARGITPSTTADSLANTPQASPFKTGKAVIVDAQENTWEAAYAELIAQYRSMAADTKIYADESRQEDISLMGNLYYLPIIVEAGIR